MTHWEKGVVNQLTEGFGLEEKEGGGERAIEKERTEE